MSPRPSTALHRWLLPVLIGVLLAAQALGLAHRVRHAGGEPAASHVAATHAADAFGHAAGDTPECRLYDALGCADATPSAVDFALSMRLPVAPAVFHASWSLAAQATGFLARGPPAFR